MVTHLEKLLMLTNSVMFIIDGRDITSPLAFSLDHFANSVRDTKGRFTLEFESS